MLEILQGCSFGGPSRANRAFGCQPSTQACLLQEGQIYRQKLKTDQEEQQEAPSRV